MIVSRCPVLRRRGELWPDCATTERSASMRVFATGPQNDLRRVGAAARAIEAELYDGIISMENQHDPFLALAVAGAATGRVELHTGVAIAFARTPMATAEVGWDLAGSTGGRFVVGLRSPGRGHKEGRLSVEGAPPAPRKRGYFPAPRGVLRCWPNGGEARHRGGAQPFTLVKP